MCPARVATWEGKIFGPCYVSRQPGAHLNWCRSALGSALGADGCLSAARWLHSVVCGGKWPLSAEPGRSFLWPFPPSQARFLSEPALHVKGYSPCRKGRLAAPRLFLFLWRLRLGAARCWNGLKVTPLEGVDRPCTQALFFP